MNFIDLFAGAGGLSEGFINAGFKPIAHVEMDKAACLTLKTRVAYHWLKRNNKIDWYFQYLRGTIDRDALYSKVPQKEMCRVINMAISDENNKKIFKLIDEFQNKQQVHLIIGGPPCQAYSLVGRARSENGMKDDPRNHLYLQYAKFLNRYKPKMFVFENVIGLRSAGDGTYFHKMKLKFNNEGYEVDHFLLNAKEFGVLQNRKRIILIGYKKDMKISMSHFKFENNLDFKVKNVFEDLEVICAGDGKDKHGEYIIGKPNEYLKRFKIRNDLDVLTQHVSRPHTEHDKKIYRIAVENIKKGQRLDYTTLPKELKTHKNQHSFFDRFKVVDENSLYSQTVVAHIAKDGHYYIHPDINQNRSISVREAARLQSFPDNYYFEGVKQNQNRTAAFKQIGNAVPPLMAFGLAKKIKKLL